ncbi:transporter substrate-binding domain-containing protein [Pseudonocardia sp. RS010]|uniref:transporter substrate-binding domain-containing protein n=1 Tax=Pseudonocardia sp. RS010 TaxID=3385979 RepID=UPI0039A20599
MHLVSRRSLLAGAAALGGAAALAGCGSRAASALERMQDDGVARIGIAGERPYGYSATDGTVTGEAPAVARAVLAGLGVGGLEAIQVPFDRLLDALLAEQFDIVTAGTTITPERCARVAFSQPDFVAPLAFLVAEGNPLGIRTFDGVRRAGVPLGVLSGSAEHEYALAAGVSPEAIRTYDGQSTLFRAVVVGDVPAAVLTRLSLLDALARNPGAPVEVTPGVAALVNADGERVFPMGAFAFRPEDTALRTAFDVGLHDLQSSGRWLEIVRPFGFTAENLPPPGVTTGSLCAGQPGL